MQSMFAGTPVFNRTLNKWNVSNVTNMAYMFCHAEMFNSGIGDWDVSSVETMENMFCDTQVFNQDISNWDVSSLTNMAYMFDGAQVFNQDISPWVVSTVVTMEGTFARTQAFNQDISSWDVSSVTNMAYMFDEARVFNQDISPWDVSTVRAMQGMFARTLAFNKNISSWIVPSLINMAYMFDGAQVFNQDISPLIVSTVLTMEGTFARTQAFNQDISSWDVSSVINMAYMFDGAQVFNQDISPLIVSTVLTMKGTFARTQAFNQDISSWDVSSVTNMAYMFDEARVFNQDISPWDLSTVTTMEGMFAKTYAFNKNLNNWDVSGVTNMAYMFDGAQVFNQDISSWDVGSVADMSYMFNEVGSFNQKLDSWNVANVTNMEGMLDNSGLSPCHYDQTLIGWNGQSFAGRTLGATGLNYCTSADARTGLIENDGWNILGDTGCEKFEIIGTEAQDLACAGVNEGILTVTVSGTSSNTRYSLDSGTSFQAGPTFSDLAPDSYRFIVTDEDSCGTPIVLESDELSIQEPEPLIVTDIQHQSVSCFGLGDGTIEIMANGGTGDLLYSLDSGRLFFDHAEFENLKSGVYTVLVTDQNSCLADYKDLERKRVISEGTEIKANAEGFSNITPDKNEWHIDLEVSGGPAPYAVEWMSSDAAGSLLLTGKEMATINNLQPGRHTLDITDLEGCSIRVSVYVPIGVRVTVPNALSPNGDGINDVWTFENIQYYPNNRLAVFNRYGQQIYQQEHYQNDWTADGLPEGAYFFVFQANGEKGEAEEIRGYFDLRR